MHVTAAPQRMSMLDQGSHSFSFSFLPASTMKAVHEISLLTLLGITVRCKS
jgi:hypothetical protein